jgi:hypothetical protein
VALLAQDPVVGPRRGQRVDDEPFAGHVDVRDEVVDVRLRALHDQRRPPIDLEPPRPLRDVDDLVHHCLKIPHPLILADLDAVPD